MVLSDQRQASAALAQGKRPGTHSVKGWVGPRARLDAGIRSPYHPAIESLNTDCGVPAQKFFIQAGAYLGLGRLGSCLGR